MPRCPRMIPPITMRWPEPSYRSLTKVPAPVCGVGAGGRVALYPDQRVVFFRIRMGAGDFSQRSLKLAGTSAGPRL